MASSKEFLDFILTQIQPLENISWRKMMGEYIIYYRQKIIGGIYDNRFLVKPVAPVIENITGEMAQPYDGAKPMFLITDIENSDVLCTAIELVYDELYS